MSDADSFIQEVSEEVRRDRMFRLWQRYAPFVIGAVVAVVAGSALMSWLDHRATMAAREAGGRLLAAAEPVGAEARARSLLAFLDGASGGAAIIGRMQAGAALAEAGDAGAAATQFEMAGAAATGEPALSALSAWRAAVARAPLAGAQATVDALSPLTFPGNPVRLLALEARGLAYLETGNASSARTDFEAVLSDPAASDGMRQRIGAYLATMGPASSPAEG